MRLWSVVAIAMVLAAAPEPPSACSPEDSVVERVASRVAQLLGLDEPAERCREPREPEPEPTREPEPEPEPETTEPAPSEWSFWDQAATEEEAPPPQGSWSFWDRERPSQPPSEDFWSYWDAASETAQPLTEEPPQEPPPATDVPMSDVPPAPPRPPDESSLERLARRVAELLSPDPSEAEGVEGGEGDGAAKRQGRDSDGRRDG